jgi:predicted transcriptional regulator
VTKQDKTMNDEPLGGNHLELAAGIVSAYVSKNPVPASSLPELIHAVHASLGSLAHETAAAPAAEPRAPAVPIKKSVTPDFIVCLDDGLKFKSLKRHLAVLGMSPDAYRAKWNLPHDYPMVAPAYASARSAMAKEMGLGRKPAASPAPAAPKRGRPKKAP